MLPAKAFSHLQASLPHCARFELCLTVEFKHPAIGLQALSEQAAESKRCQARNRRIPGLPRLTQPCFSLAQTDPASKRFEHCLLSGIWHSKPI